MPVARAWPLLVPDSETDFWLRFGAGRCHFEVDHRGRTTHLVLERTGQRARRLRRPR